MKKALTTIFVLIMLLTVAGVALVPQPAEAGCLPFQPYECVLSVASILSEIVLEVVSWFLSICGIALNLSIILTLNVKALYQSTPAIEQVWVVIRNISSIFIIFGLLYASILTIVNYGKTSVGTWVKNIIIAGLLINFSLFFVKIMIDTSNLVSMQFYRAIVPNQSLNLTGDNIGSIITASFKKGGISDIFMAGLKIPKVYNDKQGFLQTANASLMILIHTYLGSIMMVIAGLTFLAAALAFTARIAMFLFFMAFSPLYFVGIIFPKVSAYTKDYVDKFINQLIFMPAYLILLYAAMKFIGEGSFFTSLTNAKIDADSSTMAKLLLQDVGMVFQYVVALIMINLPLFAAIKLGASAPKWASGIKDYAGRWAGNVGGAVGRNTVGKIGGKLGSSFDSMAARAQSTAFGRGASSVLRSVGVSQAIRGGLNTVEKGKYGGSRSSEEIAKEDKERARVITGVQRTRNQISAINTIIGTKTPPTPEEMKNFRETIGKMSSKEVEKIDYNTLKDPVFAAHLSSSQVDKLLDGETLDDKQKEEFKSIRKESLKNILSTANSDTTKEIIKNLSGKELSKADSTIFTRNEVLDHLTPSQLQDMRDMDGTTKATIGNYIRGLGAGSPHKASGYMRKNVAEWS